MLSNKEKVALFDFCETLVNFQTADAYVNYTRLHYGKFRMSFWHLVHLLVSKLRVISFLEFLFPKSSINKRIILRQLSSESFEKLDKVASEYYLNQIRPNLIRSVVNEMVRLKNEGYRVMLISGGYYIYLKYFAYEFGIKEDDIIATRLRFINGKCAGTFEGKDCLFEEKTTRLNFLFPNKDSYFFQAYSDSKSDCPMLDWADRGVVVRNISAKKWDINNQYKEIIWEN